MNENLFILNGVLAAMAAPATAETGNAATAEPLPEAKIDESGKVTTEAAPAQDAKTDKGTEGTGGEAGMTGDTTSSVTGGETSSQPVSDEKEAGAEGADTGTNTEGATDMAGGDAGMGAGDTGMAAGGDVGNMEGMAGMDGVNTEVGTAKPITQNAPAMIGITAGVLALSILAGIVLAKLKIKKGINLYED